MFRLVRPARYDYCNGSEPTADEPCELGALAYDPDGSAGAELFNSAGATWRSAATPRNLTDHIIACPPAQCLSPAGCTTEVRQRPRCGERTT